MTADEKLDLIISLLTKLFPTDDKVRRAAAAINPGCKPVRKRKVKK